MFCSKFIPGLYQEFNLIIIFAIKGKQKKYMAQKKNFRADNTYMISTDSTDNPKLGAKVLSDGREVCFWIST